MQSWVVSFFVPNLDHIIELPKPLLTGRQERYFFKLRWRIATTSTVFQYKLKNCTRKTNWKDELVSYTRFKRGILFHFVTFFRSKLKNCTWDVRRMVDLSLLVHIKKPTFFLMSQFSEASWEIVQRGWELGWSCDGKGALKVQFVVLEAFMRSRYTVLVENSDENENSWRTE
jgi:hypothetical protein